MNHRDMTVDQLAQLEALVDACGLDAVIMGLAGICAAKSDHVLVNWQDRNLANAWMKAMTACDRFAETNAVSAVS